MEKRANIKFCVKLEKKFAETYELMKKVYGDDCMSRTQVYTWFFLEGGSLKYHKCNLEVMKQIFYFTQIIIKY